MCVYALRRNDIFKIEKNMELLNNCSSSSSSFIGLNGSNIDYHLLYNNIKQQKELNEKIKQSSSSPPPKSIILLSKIDNNDNNEDDDNDSDILSVNSGYDSSSSFSNDVTTTTTTPSVKEYFDFELLSEPTTTTRTTVNNIITQEEKEESFRLLIINERKRKRLLSSSLKLYDKKDNYVYPNNRVGDYYTEYDIPVGERIKKQLYLNNVLSSYQLKLITSIFIQSPTSVMFLNDYNVMNLYRSLDIRWIEDLFKQKHEKIFINSNNNNNIDLNIFSLITEERFNKDINDILYGNNTRSSSSSSSSYFNNHPCILLKNGINPNRLLIPQFEKKYYIRRFLYQYSIENIDDCNKDNHIIKNSSKMIITPMMKMMIYNNNIYNNNNNNNEEDDDDDNEDDNCNDNTKTAAAAADSIKIECICPNKKNGCVQPYHLAIKQKGVNIYNKNEYDRLYAQQKRKRLKIMKAATTIIKK